MALAAGTSGVQAQSGTWTNSVETGVWSDAANWLDGVIANGAGNSASFSNEFSAAVEVNLDSARSIGALHFLQGFYTITNNGDDAVNILTLAGGSKPVINVDAGAASPATLRRVVLGGSDGFTLDGGGTLNLFKENTDSANTLTGDVVLNNGTIQVQGINVDADNLANTLALNSVSSFTFINGTLNLQPAVNTTPQYGVVNGNLHVPSGGVGTIFLPVRVNGAAGDNSATIGTGIGGHLNGSGTFNVRSRHVRGNAVGDWSAFTGLLDIGPSSANADNEFRFGNPAGFPDAHVHFSGGSPLGVFYYRQLTSDTNIRMGILSGDNSGTVLRGSASAGFTLFYEVGALHTETSDTATYSGVIANGAGPAGLIKNGAGTLVLMGENTYTGPTVINNGVLRISDGFSDVGSLGAGPVTNNSVLLLGRGFGTLDVPGVISGSGAITNIGFGGLLILRGANTYTAPTVSTAGKLYVTTSSQASGQYLLQDSAEGFGVIMTTAGATLTMSGLSFAGSATLDFDLQGSPNPTASVITNTGSVALNGDVTVNVDGTGLTLGTITLLKYNSRSGSGSFVPGSMPAHVTGFTLNDDVANNRVTLTITGTFDDTLKWEGGVAGVWDIDNPANQVWREVGSGQLTNYYDGAKVLFDDTATGTTVVNVSATVSPASVSVNNTTKAYTFGGFGLITGSAAITKSGDNKLTVLTANDNSGVTRINSGTLELGDGTVDGTLGSGVITNHGTLLLNRANGPYTLANAIHGTGRVRQAGPGQVNLSGASTYSGGLTVLPETILGYNNANAAGIGGGLLVNQGIVLLAADVANNVGGGVVLTNAIFRNTGANRVIDIPISGTNVIVTFDKTPNIITLNRSVSGISGVITNLGTGLLRFNSGGGNNATGSTSALWSLSDPAGWLQARNASLNSLGAVEGVGIISAQQSGNGLTTWEVGALGTSTLFEGTIHDGLSFGQAARYTALTKVGSGTWTLNNVPMLYRSTTTVSNGVLALTGTSHPDISTNITIVSPGILNVSGRVDSTLTLGSTTTNQVLAGNGTIQGNVVLGSNGRLTPGFSIGTLTVSGSAQLGGVTVMEIDRSSSPNSDRLVAASITRGGNLVVTNLGAEPAYGDSYQLFSAPTIGGSFLSVSLPPLSCPTLSWDTSNLGVNGTIAVTGTPCVASNPTNITFSVVGNQLKLEWPESHKGWTLQVQTNALNVGLNDVWYDVPDSQLVNEMLFPINPANPTVFYQLYLP